MLVPCDGPDINRAHLTAAVDNNDYIVKFLPSSSNCIVQCLCLASGSMHLKSADFCHA